ncbi:hypothetical protein L3081_14140 [Colwellia sp. MSW7]|uniref:Uncharacterized protein n=1 Tax=Colwellia maritima TaxID=2912588 RepID=A0ABS9X265_9GAMM|nr:hypothetical protein [Colwellia maritima]MCI2284314.1 hypothetical protein [Colwellia maritima]
MIKKNKSKIKPYPEDGTAEYSHLQPIVDFLIENGNKSVNQYIWGNNRTGYFCHLQKDIDFEGLKREFDFPESIKFNEEKQSIDCFNTYTLIKKFSSD